MSNNGSNSSEYIIEPADLSEKISEMADGYQRRKDLAASFEKSSLQISSQNFEIMLSELLENSLKFTGKGSRITVEGVNNGEYYRLRISDEGIRSGKINFENIKAFQKFDKLGLTQEGMGMGLAIVKKIIELNLGYLNFEGSGDSNTVVEIGIPAF